MPPPGVAESDWAFMLYGPGICGVRSVLLVHGFRLLFHVRFAANMVR